MIETINVSEKKLDENYRFRTYLKIHADEKALDCQFKKLHAKYFKKEECYHCRNCCKVLGVSMSELELKKLCEHYKLDIDKLKKSVLKEEYGEYVASPCPFLNADNSCQIEDCLPLSCQEYPYTNKDERLYSLLTVVQNSEVCPVVYHILEDLKEIYHFKRR